jgi:hypothetical protein
MLASFARSEEEADWRATATGPVAAGRGELKKDAATNAAASAIGRYFR